MTKPLISPQKAIHTSLKNTKGPGNDAVARTFCILVRRNTTAWLR